MWLCEPQNHSVQLSRISGATLMSHKETARQAFIAGMKYARNTEEVSDIAIRAANTKFDEWWEQNGEEDATDASIEELFDDIREDIGGSKKKVGADDDSLMDEDEMVETVSDDVQGLWE